MIVVDTKTNESFIVSISPVTDSELRSITKKEFWFNWKEESEHKVYKLQINGTQEVLGLISLEAFEIESRIEIRLLAVSRENRGKNKKYERIAGNLLAFAAKEAIKMFGEWACISLVPKTELIEHYCTKYYMTQAGRSLFSDGMDLIRLIQQYDHE